MTDKHELECSIRTDVYAQRMVLARLTGDGMQLALDDAKRSGDLERVAIKLAHRLAEQLIHKEMDLDDPRLGEGEAGRKALAAAFEDARGQLIDDTMESLAFSLDTEDIRRREDEGGE